MRVRMMVGVSGTRSGVDWPPAGAELECSDAEGAQLCAGGLAVPVATHAEAEAAAVPAAEERGGEAAVKSDPAARRAGRQRPDETAK